MKVKKTQNDPLLQVENLKKYFPFKRGFWSKQHIKMKAVDNISFVLNQGETFSLVGESGCGKTTTGRCVLRIYKPTSGKIYYNGKEISSCSEKSFKPFRREIQPIFQDPYGSLDPRQSAYSTIKEAVTVDNKRCVSVEIKDKVEELLLLVGLDPRMGDRFPHEMSGGQRQRLGISRALACSPRIIVCDEPVSALDVSIQAQIINLFKELQKKLNLAYLFISHDLAVVRQISNTIGVMYLGKIVEISDKKGLYNNPLHPYTKALLSVVPSTNYYLEKKKKRIILPGEVQSLINIPSGCPFNPRCNNSTEICRTTMPQLIEYENGHKVACHNI